MKVLIIAACKVATGTDQGAVHVGESEVIDVSKDQAAHLTQNNRALYIDRKDDPFKDGRFTASKEIIQAAEDLAKARAAAAKAKNKPAKQPDEPVREPVQDPDNPPQA